MVALSNELLLKSLIELMVIFFIGYLIYREEDVVRWEKKVYRFIKAFAKATVVTVKRYRDH